MTPEEQLEKWVNGESTHNFERDECCPDFSCCCEGIKTPIEERRLFKMMVATNNRSGETSMLMSFLGRAMAHHQKEKGIYIAGEHDLAGKIKEN